MEFEEVASPRTIADQIYDQIRWKLLVGGFMPGEKVITRHIAHAMKVSFTPAREALLRLSKEGALVVSPRFFLVPRLSTAAVEEIYRLRRLLETELALAALPNLTAIDLERLKSTQEDMVLALTKQEFGKALEYNHSFHFGIYSAADRPITLQIVDELWVRCGPSLNYMYPRLRKKPGHIHGHIPILDALDERDAVLLQRTLENDLNHGLQSIKQTLDHSDGSSAVELAEQAVDTLSA